MSFGAWQLLLFGQFGGLVLVGHAPCTALYLIGSSTPKTWENIAVLLLGGRVGVMVQTEFLLNAVLVAVCTHFWC